ncbi:MAG: hypothetical protein IPL61_19650 [Myxococcales bacterium]|nr:hypothetical protein [Myxococcales bacterium]
MKQEGIEAGNRYTRQELQAELGKAVVATLSELGINAPTLSVEHGRRIVRALLRLGARLARTRAWSLEQFVAAAVEAYVDEAPSGWMPPVAQA